MTFGEDLGWGSSVEVSNRIMDRYLDLGGNFIDTANIYTKTHSEKIVGEHLGRNTAKRDRLMLSTKFSGNKYPGDPNGGEANTLAHFRGWAPFVAMQIEYSLLGRTVEQELIPMAADFNIGVLPWSPLREGILSGKYTRDSAGKIEGARSAARVDQLTDDTYDLIDELGRIAKKHDTTIARVAPAWVTQQPGVTSTVIGARTMQQFAADHRLHQALRGTGTAWRA